MVLHVRMYITNIELYYWLLLTIDHYIKYIPGK